MQNINNILMKAALVLFAAVLATGCIFEKMDRPEKLQSVMILLNVSDQGMQTKADPSEMESKINTLHIYAFCNGQKAGYMVRQETEQNIPFLMDLLLPAYIPDGTDAQNTHRVQFYLVANAASMLYENVQVSLSEKTTQAELEALSFTGLVQKSPLPLYCVKSEDVNVGRYTSTDEAGHEDHYYLEQQVSFSLSRSLAKVSIYGARAEESQPVPQIQSVTMLAGGTRQYSYLFPQSDEIINSVPSRANGRTLISSAVSLPALKGTNLKTASNYTALMESPVYLPEVTYGSDADHPDQSSGNDRAVVFQVDYRLKEAGETKTGYIYMPPIERNHHYKVCILVNSMEEGQLSLSYTVADWEDHMINNYEFDYPTHSYLRDRIPTNQAEVNARPSAPATMSETVPFVGYFQMTAPLSDEWVPTLVGENASEADVEVFKREADASFTKVTTYPVKAGSDWYMIKVIPKTGFTIGKSVDLAITYEGIGGFNTSEFLLINGSAGEYYWPGSTDANFVTITME